MSPSNLLRADRFRLETADVRGFAQAFAREGKGGFPLVLVHGWPETQRISWRNLQVLCEEDFEVIAPDLRGFGDSGAEFCNPMGPFLVRDAGHFLQWEAADILNGAVRAFCRDLLDT